MQNLALIVVLAAKKRRQCPCGAVADQPPYGLCRKCDARNAWRRKVAGTRRKAARRRLAHSVARFLADALTPLTTVGMES